MEAEKRGAKEADAIADRPTDAGNRHHPVQQPHSGLDVKFRRDSSGVLIQQSVGQPKPNAYFVQPVEQNIEVGLTEALVA
ncbi:MAG: hypothetical protein ACRD2H_11940 [Terriglobales bacterium]